jgi:hypothetical protein
MVKDMQQLLLRAFNNECDECINNVKYNNFDSAKQRITTSRDAISKLGAMLSVAITAEYFKLKIEELHLAFKYRQKVQAEKEREKKAREQLREANNLKRKLRKLGGLSKRKRNIWATSWRRLRHNLQVLPGQTGMHCLPNRLSWKLN